MSLYDLEVGNGVIYFPQLKRKAMLKRGYATAFLFATIIGFFIFSVSVFLFSLPARSSASNATSNQLAAAAPALVSAAGTPTEEIHVANNGLVLLRAARVVSVNGTALTLGMSWGSTTFTWIVRTAASSYGTHNYGTRFIDRSGNAIGPENIQAGSLVTVTGMLDSNANVPTLDADTVRSLQ